LLCEELQPCDLRELIIFGSAAITLNEKDLNREIDDLDLFASESLYSKLKLKDSLKEGKKNDVTYLKTGVSKIEIWKSFPGVEYDTVKINSRTNSRSNGLLLQV
jgi:hypothetical protein